MLKQLGVAKKKKKENKKSFFEKNAETRGRVSVSLRVMKYTHRRILHTLQISFFLLYSKRKNQVSSSPRECLF